MKTYTFILLTIIFGITSSFIAQPVINSFSPLSGPIGSTVVISGANFNSVASNNIVYFGATKAIVNSATTSQLSVIVPDGMTYEPISVTNNANGLTGYSQFPFTTSFICSSPLDSLSFAVQDTLGHYSHYTATGDIDGDGKTDLGVVIPTNNNLFVYRNISVAGSNQITYANWVNFNVGSGDHRVVFKDLDGDGKLDAIVTNQTSNSITVYRNTSVIGAISFSPRLDYVSGTYVTGLAIGDIDGDGKPEIINANLNTDNISIFKNTSTVGVISFAARVNYYSGDGPTDCRIADIDSDQKSDIIVSNSGESTLAIFRNLSAVSSLSLAPPVVIPSGNYPQGVSVGDLDSDGKIDLATSDWNSNTVSVYKNLSSVGNINFDPKISFGTGIYPLYVAINDLDGDAKPELLVTHYWDNIFCIYHNLSTVGSVSYSSKIQFPILASPRGFAIADMDGDKRPDIAVTALLYRNLNGKCPIPVVDSFMPKQANVDAIIDIYGANFNIEPNYNLVQFGDTKATVLSGSSNHLSVKVPKGANYRPITVTDTISKLQSSSEYFFTPTFSCGKPIDSTSFAPPISFSTNANPGYLATGDLDGDGLSDVVLVSGSSNAFSIYRNISVSGAPNFAPKIDISLPNPLDVELADMNGDGKLDLIVANAMTHAVNIYVNTTSTIGNITFSPPLSYASGFFPYGLAVGDIDKDGKPDIVICNYGPGTISVYRNTSFYNSLSFGPAQNYGVGSNPSDVAIGDLDGDHYPELIVSNYWSHNMSVFRNLSSQGAIQLDSKIDYYVGLWGPNGITLADVDKDGKSDVLVAVGSDNFVAVLKNTSTLGIVSLNPGVNFGGGVPIKLAISDWDGNGEVEFFTGGGSIGVFQNSSSVGTISLSPSFYNYPSKGIVMADIDGDKRNDLLFTDSNSDNFVVVRNVNLYDMSANDITVSMSNFNVLSASQGSSYQWLDCSAGYAPINGATSQTYTATIGGSYAVIVTQGTCVDTSACFSVFLLGSEKFKEKDFLLYPNPISNYLTIECSDVSICEYEIEVFNSLGALVFNSSVVTKKNIDTHEWETGIYLIRLSNANKVITKRFIKE